MKTTTLLQKEHQEKRKHILKRLSQFKRFPNQNVVWRYDNEHMQLMKTKLSPEQRMFEELSFCILAANTSAEMGMKTIDRLREVLQYATPNEMTRKIQGLYRFINVRPEYIVHSRTYLMQLEATLHEIVQSISDKHELRDFLANNTGIKGIGYKEASHFLRNVGVGGFAILDKHIVNSMHEFGVIGSNRTPTSKKQYLDLEQKYLSWATQLGIHPDELDLLLWSRKTGKILK